jgi:poly(ADP-ribose) glycohydrolase ARH3
VGRIEETHLCNAFATDYEPDRGYGPGARKILAAMVRNEDWREVARTIFPGGSLGNGAAMRAAPVGLFFHNDLDRIWNEARLAALPTHVHPIGIEGAQLIALAVALAMRSPQLDRSDFYAQLLRRAVTEEFQRQLNLAAKLDSDGSVAQFGNDMKANSSVVTAIACFTQAPRSYANTIARAISLGGDCDTIAAMAGAISGAHLGVAALPPKLLDRLENGKKGRDYLVQLAMQLWSKSSSVTR